MSVYVRTHRSQSVLCVCTCVHIEVRVLSVCTKVTVYTHVHMEIRGSLQELALSSVGSRD